MQFIQKYYLYFILLGVTVGIFGFMTYKAIAEINSCISYEGKKSIRHPRIPRFPKIKSGEKNV